MQREFVRIDAGEDTEDLARFIARGLTPEELDNVELDRERKEVAGVAQEPITIALAICISAKVAADAGAAAVGVATVITVGKLIETWIIQKYRKDQTERAVKIWPKDRELARILLKNIEQFSEVSIQNEMQPSAKID